MTEYQFLARMDLIRERISNHRSGDFLCYRIKEYLDVPARDYFQNVFIRVQGEIYEFLSTNEYDTELDWEDQKAQRMTAILFFEEMCLQYKDYRKW